MGLCRHSINSQKLTSSEYASTSWISAGNVVEDGCPWSTGTSSPVLIPLFSHHSKNKTIWCTSRVLATLVCMSYTVVIVLVFSFAPPKDTVHEIWVVTHFNPCSTRCPKFWPDTSEGSRSTFLSFGFCYSYSKSITFDMMLQPSVYLLVLLGFTTIKCNNWLAYHIVAATHIPNDNIISTA